MPIAGPAVPSMALSSMIEEKGLKKGFMVATLVSAVLSTFITSHNLYSQVKDKRDKKRQEATDAGQDQKLQKMQQRLDQIADGKGNNQSNDDKIDKRYIEDAISKAMMDSQAVVSREFEKGRAHLGERFDQGDIYAENQLQKVVIQYQQTVINVLQNALNGGRQLDARDRAQIADATDYARESTLDALRAQYKRLSDGPSRRMSLPPAFNEQIDDRRFALPEPDVRRNDSAVSVSSHRSMALAPPKRMSEVPSSLYCQHSLDLQFSNRGLTPNFDAGRGDSRCPDCNVRIPVTAGSSWEIIKPVNVMVSTNGRAEKKVEERAYKIDSRFIVKCHTETGMYACLLCNKKRDFDALCKEPETLVGHIAKAHTEIDFADEVDIFELR